MGCDIHMFVEYKIGDAPWQADKNHRVSEEDGYRNLEQFPFTSRNYELFGKLAGVRTSGPDPKGLPDDASEIIKNSTKEDENYGDDHSHSYCSFKEYKAALKAAGVKLKKHGEIKWDSRDYESSYSQGIAYIEQQLNRLKIDLEAEKQLLGQDINTNVEARLLFWFDN